MTERSLRQHYAEVRVRLGVGARSIEEDEAYERKRQRAKLAGSLSVFPMRKKTGREKRPSDSQPRKSRVEAKAARLALLNGLPAWEDIGGLVSPTASLDEIAAIVLARFEGVTLDSLREYHKADNTIRARYLIARAAKQNGESYSEIARFLNRNHASVMALLKRDRRASP